MRRMRVLLVDDDESLLDGMVRAFHEQDFVTLTAQCAEQALQVFEACDVDLVVCDEQMPGMGGSDLLSQLSHEYPETIRIMLTGAVTLTSAQRAVTEGLVCQYFHKPCPAKTIIDTVQYLLLDKSLTLEAEDYHQPPMSTRDQEALLQMAANKERTGYR